MNSKILLTIVFALFILISGVLFMTSTPKDSSLVYEFEDIDLMPVASSEPDTGPGEAQSPGSHEAQAVEERDISSQADGANPTIIVYLHGAVENAGVYELKTGSRVHEALDMAGGMLENASTKQVNLARFLVDGESIYFPTREEEVELKEEADSVTDPRVNLNSASREVLMTLPGIGDTKARSIIAYRTLNGDFKEIEEIMNVSGIKESLFESLQSMIRL